MAYIKNLQMWNDICADAHIGISSQLFGLKTKVTYLTTQSVIEADTYGFRPSVGEQLLSILTAPRTELASAIGNFRPKRVTNGHYLLEIARSRDRRFIALRLLQFQNFVYKPVTDTLFYEDEDARLINQML